MTFKKWISHGRNKTNRNSRLYDFVTADADFPDTSSRILIIAHLQNANAGQELIDDFKRAWASYLAYLRNKA